MKTHIANLKAGDTVQINGGLYDVFDTPTKMDDGEYCFTVVGHGAIETVRQMEYITPAHLAYETSANFENGEIIVVKSTA
ncbi:MAG: hypothetical protein IJ419_12015 [Agathobacter sp.]|nr:hypothetical protein [Agathobacter sp.]